MNCDPQVREHLHQARDAAHKAARTAADDLGERLVSSEVRGHLRSAARSMLHAGLAALDAHEARQAKCHQPAAAPVTTPATPPTTA